MGSPRSPVVNGDDEGGGDDGDDDDDDDGDDNDTLAMKDDGFFRGLFHNC